MEKKFQILVLIIAFIFIFILGFIIGSTHQAINASSCPNSCDRDGNGIYDTADADSLTNDCIFGGYSNCANVDVNGDGKADSGDISALILCKNNNNAFSNCNRADVNKDGQINTDDSQLLTDCIYSSCAQVDPNGDGIIDAGDLSYCTINCFDESKTKPTSVPTVIISSTPLPQPTSVLPTSILPTNINQNPTQVIPTQQITPSPTQIITQPPANITTPLITQVIKTNICDRNKDNKYDSKDTDLIIKCIFNGWSYCANTDINGDGLVDSGDISAAILCANDINAFNNCKGADFNGDNLILQYEIVKLNDCIYSGCSNFDPNKDNKIDAGDISYCIKENPPSINQKFNCQLCGDTINYCSHSNIDILTSCIFNPEKNGCQDKDSSGYNIWDVNKDKVVDAGDVSAYILCSDCKNCQDKNPSQAVVKAEDQTKQKNIFEKIIDFITKKIFGFFFSN